MNTKGVLVQRGQIRPFWYSFVTETALRMMIEGNRILGLKKLGGTPGVIRTPDPLLRRQVLYPAELRAHIRWLGRMANAPRPLYSFARVGRCVNIVMDPQFHGRVFMI